MCWSAGRILAQTQCSSRRAHQAIPRHGCLPAEFAVVSPGEIIVPRIVIGRVIFEQPAGGGIGRCWRRASSLRSRRSRIQGCRNASISCGATNPMALCSPDLGSESHTGHSSLGCQHSGGMHSLASRVNSYQSARVSWSGDGLGG